MAEIGKKYNEILKDLEQNIKDPKELEYVKEKFSDLSMLFIDMLDRMTLLTNSKMKEIENKQQEISNRINSVQSIVDEIESDIYEEEFEDGYEFEIVCPYCNYKFLIDLNNVNSKEEVQCPECKNIIELDWNCEEEEDGCSCGCSSCHGSCVAENEEDYKIENDDENEEDM